MQQESGPIGSLNLSKEVHIIGAGVSGLLMGYYLKESGYNVTLFEKASRVGGKIETIQTCVGPVEKAANAIFTNEDVMELLKQLQLPYLPSREKLRRKVWRNGKARSFPLAPWELLRMVWGLLKGLPDDLEKLSVYDFFRPLLGKKTAYQVLSAVFGGIYATDAKSLHFKSVFKEEIAAKNYFAFIKELINRRKQRKHKPTSISFEKGMQSFIDALSARLKDNIVHQERKDIDPDANTIICGDALEAAEMLGKRFPKVSQELSQISYQSLSTGTYIFQQEARPLENSFGILFPPRSGFKSSGILNNSAIFTNRVFHPGRHSYTFISQDAKFDKKDALNELRILSPNQQWQELEAKQTRWTRAVPVYNLQRHRTVKKLRALFHEVPSGLVLFGNYIDGISIREMASMAKGFAKNN